MTSDRPELHARELVQSSGLNTVDILSDKRVMAAGALAAIGVGAFITHKLNPEILKPVLDEARDVFKFLGGGVPRTQASRLGRLLDDMCLSERSAEAGPGMMKASLLRSRAVDSGANITDSRAGKAVPSLDAFTGPVILGRGAGTRVSSRYDTAWRPDGF